MKSRKFLILFVSLLKLSSLLGSENDTRAQIIKVKELVYLDNNLEHAQRFVLDSIGFKKNDSLLALYQVGRAFLFFEEEQLDSSELYAKKALTTAEAVRDTDLILEALYRLSDISFLQKEEHNPYLVKVLDVHSTYKSRVDVYAYNEWQCYYYSVAGKLPLSKHRLDGTRHLVRDADSMAVYFYYQYYRYFDLMSVFDSSLYYLSKIQEILVLQNKMDHPEELKRHYVYTLIRNKQYKKALAMAKETLAGMTPQKYSRKDSCFLFRLVGQCYEEMNVHDSAITYFNMSSALAPNTDYVYVMSQNAADIGIVHKNLGDYNKAMEYFQTSIRLEPLDIVITSIVNGEIAQCLLELGKYKEAISYFELAIKQNNKTGQLEVKEVIYDKYAQCLAKLRDFEKAYTYAAISKEIKDSIFKLEKEKLVQNMQYEFESQFNTIENKQLKKDLERQKELSEKERKIKYFTLLTSFLSLFGLIIVLLYFYNRSRFRKRIIALQKADRKRLLEQLKENVEDLGKQKDKAKSLENRLKHKSISKDKINEVIRNLENVENWPAYIRNFEQTYSDELERIEEILDLKLTKSDLRILALHNLSLTNKETASVLGITEEGVKKAKYRLRKKLEANQSMDSIPLLESFLNV